MKAIVFDFYGPPEVLRVESVERPNPAPDELLVRVHATTVNRMDVHTREANRSGGRVMYLVSRLIFGYNTPRRRILGTEFAGEVVEVGAGVNEFKVGDRVFGTTSLRFGAHAEYLTIRASGRVAAIPEGMGYEEAAAITDGALNALTCLKGALPGEGKSILVYGASGAIGTAGVQLARHFGFEVTAVTSRKNLELVSSLNPHHLIDRDQEDFRNNGVRYDAILDAVGKLRFRDCRRSLKESGVYLPTDGPENLWLVPWTSLRKGQRVVFQIPPRVPREDVLLLKRLVESGEFKPVIDRRYPLEEVVEASRYVETQRKRGNVVLTVG